jgi:hypothetical protein
MNPSVGLKSGMTKKNFISLADKIRRYNQCAFEPGSNIVSPLKFTDTQLTVLADFCAAQNSAFNRERWFDYIAGRCGPSGGRVK